MRVLFVIASLLASLSSQATLGTECAPTLEVAQKAMRGERLSLEEVRHLVKHPQWGKVIIIRLKIWA